MTPILLRVSTPDEELADALAERMVCGRLAASVHVSGPIKTTYRWRDLIHKAVEYQVEARTLRERIPQAEALIRSLHPFEVPEIFLLPLEPVTPDYAAWLNQAASGCEVTPAPRQ